MKDDSKDENDFVPDWIAKAHEIAGLNKPDPHPSQKEVVFWAAFQQAQWDKRELKAKNKRLREYAHHDKTCSVGYSDSDAEILGIDNSKCTCGFDKALTGE